MGEARLIAAVQWNGGLHRPLDRSDISPVSAITEITAVNDRIWADTPSGPCEVHAGDWVTRCTQGHTHVIPGQFYAEFFA